jgi:hypothetical protein
MCLLENDSVQPSKLVQVISIVICIQSWKLEIDAVRRRLLSTRAPHFEKAIFIASGQWYSTFFVRVPPDIISLRLCTPKVVGV